MSQEKNTKNKTEESVIEKKKCHISRGDLVYVAGELKTFNDMHGSIRHHHLIANPILGLVISVIENIAVLFISEQPHLEQFSYASIKLDSDIIKITKVV